MGDLNQPLGGTYIPNGKGHFYSMLHCTIQGETAAISFTV